MQCKLQNHFGSTSVFFSNDVLRFPRKRWEYFLRLPWTVPLPQCDMGLGANRAKMNLPLKRPPVFQKPRYKVDLWWWPRFLEEALLTLQGTRCLGSVELVSKKRLKPFLFYQTHTAGKMFYLNYSRIQWPTQICLEIAWFSFYCPN